jgi:uncharacterized glyoxalase superfamily protein PhnB
MTTGLNSLVPMAQVSDVARSIAFYERLGFAVENTFEEGGTLQWAYLTCGGAQLMVTLAQADDSDRTGRGVSLYVYAEDVVGYHRDLGDRGLDVSPLERRFYMEKGEFELTDPDGHHLYVGHV